MLLIGPEGHATTRELVEELPKAQVRIGRRPPGATFPPLKSADRIGQEDFAKSTGDGLTEEDRAIHALVPGDTVDAAKFFQLPPNRVVEIGVQIEF